MKRDTKIVAALLVGVSAAILAASAVCCVLIARGASMRWRILFRAFCHGIPERCLTLWNVPMPICARCTAIYAGLILSFAIFAVIPRITERAARIVLFGAAVPMALDGLSQLAQLRVSTNGLRMETGLVAGIAFGFWALTAIDDYTTVTIP